MSLEHSTSKALRLAVSKRTAAEALDVSIDTIKRKVSRGELEQIQVGPRRVAITMRSLEKLLPAEAE